MTSLRPFLADGYTLILPPGWLRLDARTDRGTEGLDRELDQILSTVPRDSYGPLIAQVRKQAHTVLDQARNAGAPGPLPPPGRQARHRGPRVLPGLHDHLRRTTTRSRRLPDCTSHDPEATSARIGATLAARMPGGEVKQMPAGIAVRSRQGIAATGTSQWPGTRVDYHWPLPSQPMKWALASFTTIGAGKPDDDLTELLIGLFDAIMLTWRWQPGHVI